MRVFLQVLKAEFASYLAYRLNFILWRLRNFLWLVFLYSFWKAVFGQKIEIFSYTKNEIFLYLLIAQVTSAFVLSTTTDTIGGIINDGRLTNFLLLPYSFFKIIAGREVVDKFLNLSFSIIEISLFLWFFKPKIAGVNFTFVNLSLFLLFIVLAVVLYFFISLNLGFIGFWSTEVWAPRFLFMVLIWLLAGNYFPLDIMPLGLYKALKILPFGYLIYFPTKILLGKFSVSEITEGLLVLFFWAVFFSIFAKWVWKKGLKVYTAQGA